MKLYHTFVPDMCSSWLKNMMIVGLLMIFINRAVFVAMPGVETSSSNADINSLLEMIIGWAGMPNDLDEDGDSPENYNIANTAKLIVCQTLESNYVNCPSVSLHKTFNEFDEDMLSSGKYGTIDHPPQIT